MTIRIKEDSEMIDYATSRSICDAVGERLQRSFPPEALDPSSRLQDLVDQLRRQDDRSHG